MSEKIKVLQLGSPSGLYGAERWILALIRHLNPSLVESWVASIRDMPDQEVPLCAEAEKLGFQTYIFNNFGKLNLSVILALREFIIENGIDIVHSHGYKTDIIGLLAVRGTACKSVSTPHGWTKQPDMKLLLYELVDRFIFPFMDAVAPLSDGLNTSLKRIPGLRKKIRLIHNAVDIDEIRSNKAIADEISELKGKGKFVIGYIGRLTPGKGLDILFHAVASHGDPDWHIAIVGEGEQFSELSSMAAKLEITDQITFFGFRPDRISFLNGFNLFVLPSRSEGIPRCLMESMTAGVPVVASDIPGCRNLVDGETTGLLFQSDNAGQLAESIRKILSEPALSKRFIENGQRFIENNYAARRMAREYEDLFYGLCGLSLPS